MKETTAKWMLFGAMCIGAPIFMFAFVIAALVPISGLPAVFLSDPDTATAILCLVHLAIYGTVFYLFAKILAKAVLLLPSAICFATTTVLCSVLVVLPFFPLYGYCMTGCDHMTLLEFYQRAGAAA